MNDTKLRVCSRLAPALGSNQGADGTRRTEPSRPGGIEPSSATHAAPVYKAGGRHKKMQRSQTRVSTFVIGAVILAALGGTVGYLGFVRVAASSAMCP